MLKVSRRWHWTRHFISRSKRKPTWSQLPFRQRAWCLPWIALRCCGLLPSLRLDIASMPRRLPPHPLKKNNLQLPDTNTKNKRKEGGGGKKPVRSRCTRCDKWAGGDKTDWPVCACCGVSSPAWTGLTRLRSSSRVFRLLRSVREWRATRGRGQASKPRLHDDKTATPPVIHVSLDRGSLVYDRHTTVEKSQLERNANWYYQIEKQKVWSDWACAVLCCVATCCSRRRTTNWIGTFRKVKTADV